MSEAPSSNPKFLLHLHTESERASQQFTCVTKNKNKIHSRKSSFECKAWSWHHHHYYYPLKNQPAKKKYTENRLNNSSDQLYMQRTNNITNKHKRCWKRKVGARVQRKILGLPGEDDSEMFLRSYSRAGLAAATPGAAFACSVIAGRHGDWWVSRIEQRNKQNTGREREKRRRRDPRGRRETEGETEGESERAQENRRARFLAMAFWLRSDDGVYTAQGPCPAWS